MEKLKNHLKRLSKFENALALLHWDMETYMPSNAAERRAKIIGEISTYVFEEFVSEKTKEYLESANPKTSEDEAIIRLVKKELEKVEKIPPKLFKELQIANALSQQAWQKAKEKAAFNIFKPHLEKVVKLQKEVIEHIGYEKNRYDTLLDNYEPGLKTETLKKIIPTLRKFLVDFVDELENGEKPNTDILEGEYDVEKQREFSLELLKMLNYDLTSGRLDASAHPFTISISHNDVRITTRFDKYDIKNSIFSTIHECGHALYEQGIPEEYRELPIGDGASMGIHESQSRFWENIVGRSLEFWNFVYPTFVKYFPRFKDVEVEEFWRAINIVERSLIRTEADEVTYNLHIMLRFELEEALINDKITVEELPMLWNEKMKEYLNITPKNNAEGVLQDVHWAHGSFGYFPSYMLGNLYASQILFAMKKDIQNIEEKIQSGQFDEILSWLRNKIHSKGKVLEPNELIKEISGEELNPNYFVSYIKEKYSKVYRITH
ncbi:peptidase M32 [Thermosipho melanesiensis]|uniref:Metal-dependent carboxypeptidase n=2 Tax=Thermosipho melanesiensis TaxID=46541 RepID=A6LKE4_THEM4|nr:carboxypeptidase M32 [Thermosipho melanesiensis]ABR30395.1 Carboxypeptidase Taq [Thermosipho melanesiensis BI429]APT73557.1 peptidase M32 [Thermosipho melanesiensis]OOC37508.1 peptidase M32 [Thermosipho melanesiensis]OOC39547.1 peptidase M32 [Thermosipho melanesiensis]OOC39564.1 peptidase M32 [Thermosipho melanesiensis]